MEFAKMIFSKQFLYLYAVGQYTYRGRFFRKVAYVTYDVILFMEQMHSSRSNHSDPMVVALQLYGSHCKTLCGGGTGWDLVTQ